jgi:hypothetical protein
MQAYWQMTFDDLAYGAGRRAETQITIYLSETMAHAQVLPRIGQLFTSPNIIHCTTVLSFPDAAIFT